MTANGDRLAYPMSADDERSTGIDGWGERGMTRREAFTMAAMQGLCAAGFATDPRTASNLARQHADALLAELAKEPTNG